MKNLKDYLKPGYVIETESGNKYVVTQDVHGNIFGIRLGSIEKWAPLDYTIDIVAIYQIDKPCNYHYPVIRDHYLTKVWERKEVELTLQEIADKFGIDVNQLRIKK